MTTQTTAFRSRHPSARVNAAFSRRCLIVVALLSSLGIATLAPSPASAGFTRPYIRQIASIPGGFLGGVAVDSADNLWAGAGSAGGGRPLSLDEFEYPFDTFTKAVEIEAREPAENGGLTPPERLAIGRSTEGFYTDASDSTTGHPGTAEAFGPTGAFLTSFDLFGGGFVAVDNSAESSAGTIYIASRSDHAIGKFNQAGEPMDFSEAGKGVAYVSGNEITGYPGDPAFGFEEPCNIAVDSHGNIYTFATSYEEGAGAVLEYAPSGAFIRAFSGSETPGIRSNKENKGFGAPPVGLAVDPSSGDVLVSLNDFEQSKEGPVAVEGVVDEFDSSGRFLGQLTETDTGHRLKAPGGHVSIHSPHEMAVDSHDDLYVGEAEGIAVYGPAQFLPGVRISQARAGGSTSETLNGLVNPEAKVDPEHRGLSACTFEYVTEAEFRAEGFTGPATKVIPCAPSASEITPELTEDETWHTVHADAGNLTSGTTYRYRITAGLGGEKGGSSSTAPAAFTAPHPPTVSSTLATNISSSYAELKAEVDPLGADTTYSFQYVDETDYKVSGYADAQSTAPRDIGSGGSTGSSQESVAQHIGPLTPGTGYVFRVVAQNQVDGALKTTDGPDTVFATLPPPLAGLPDNRAYELVTPANKAGGSDMFGLFPTNDEFFNDDDGVASESGDGFLLTTHAGFGSFPGNEQSAYVFARHAGSGWGYTSLASSSLGVQNVGAGVLLYDPADLSVVGFNDEVGSLASEGGRRQMSVLGVPGGPYTTLHINSPVYAHEVRESGETRLVGASSAVTHVVLGSHDYTLCPGAERQKSGEVLCEWSGVYETINGETRPQLKLVNASNEGKLLRPCGAVLGVGGVSGRAHNAISADGSRVLFTAPDPMAQNDGAGCWNGSTSNAPQLYMRTHGRTIEISEPEVGVSDPTGQHGVEYVGASKDDSKIYFVTETELTRQAAELGLHDAELYECEIVEAEAGRPSCKLTRVSAGEAGTPGAERGAEVFTVPAVADSGGAVYFTAYAALASGATQLEAATGAGSNFGVNLYRYSDGKTTYVATVSAADYISNYWSCGMLGKEAGPSRALCPTANWYTTPDGRYLLFSTWRELTGYRTASSSGCLLPGTEGGANGHCTELYRYDAEQPVSVGKPGVADNPLCVSCDRSGAPPQSDALFARSAPTSSTAGTVRAMSSGGEYAFFDSADPLVPQAENHTLDVYEWEADGTGGCTLPEGCVRLIGSGSDAGPSFFLGASADGSNVFIGTHANLIPSQNTASQGNIYDARICTETDPCVKPPAGETAQCEGDACQSVPPAPIDATPGSLTFSLAEYLTGAPTVVVAKTKAALTNRHRLAAALKLCRRGRRPRRAKCEATARRRYGPKAKRPTAARHAKTSGRARP